MKKIIIYTSAIFLLSMVNACNDSSDSKKEAEKANDAKIDSSKKADTLATTNNRMADLKSDADFAVAAADGGMLEVKLGKMAEQKGVSSSIKKLGAMMVKDHGEANDELKKVAMEKNIILPASLSDKCQKKVSDLSEKNGQDFDKAYADLMVSDHKEDIDDFKKEGDKGNDVQLSAWAKNKVPVLEHHLTMAENAKKIVDK